MTPCERLSLAIHLESAAIAPQTSELIEAAKEVLRENERLNGEVGFLQAEMVRAEEKIDDAREQRRKWQEASVADRAENHRLREALARAAIWLECDGLHSRADEMRAICQQLTPQKE